MGDDHTDHKPEITTAKQIRIQFRTSDIGDLGPYVFDIGTNAQALKEKLWQVWPAPGTEMSEKVQQHPTSASDFRLILGGRSMDPGDTLGQSSFVQLGEHKADSLVTIHVVVRAGISQGQKAGKYAADADRNPGCSCCIQ